MTKQEELRKVESKLNIYRADERVLRHKVRDLNKVLEKTVNKIAELEKYERQLENEIYKAGITDKKSNGA